MLRSYTIYAHSRLKDSGQNGVQGAVMLELVVVAPLLLIFFSGLLFAGSLLSQVSWVTQACYQSALIGGETPENLSYARMDHRLQTFVQLLGKDFEEGEVQYTREIVTNANNSAWKDVRTGIKSPLIKLGPLVPTISLLLSGPYVADVMTLEGLGDFPSDNEVLDWGPKPLPNPNHSLVAMMSGPTVYVADRAVNRDPTLSHAARPGGPGSIDGPIAIEGGTGTGSGR